MSEFLAHIGDLGNILADDQGRDGCVEGVGIEGLAVVVYAGADDLGLGGNVGARAVGNA